MQIYINRDGQQFGPFTIEQVNEGLAAGQLLPTDFAFFEGLPQWTPLNQIQGVVIPGTAAIPTQSGVTAADPVMAEESTEAVKPVVTKDDASAKKKKIIKIAGISIGIIALTCVLLYVWPGFLKEPEMEYLTLIEPIIPTKTGQTGPGSPELPDVSDFRTVSYSRDIKLIFENKCVKCHGKDEPKGKLDLSNKEGVVAGADGNPIYVADKPEESLIVELILHPDDPMPPSDKGEPLTEEEKKEIIAWIAQGAEFN